MAILGIAAVAGGFLAGTAFQGSLVLPEGLQTGWSWSITMAFGSLTIMVGSLVVVGAWCAMHVVNNVLVRDRELVEALRVAREPRLVMNYGASIEPVHWGQSRADNGQPKLREERDLVD